MPTTAQRQALADEARWIKARDAALQATPGASSLLAAMDSIIHEMMRTGTDPDQLKEWLNQAVDLHDLATPEVLMTKPFDNVWLTTEENRLYNHRFAGMEEEEVLQLLQDWRNDGGCEAACENGCWIEPDGECSHNKPSWLRILELI